MPPTSPFQLVCGYSANLETYPRTTNSDTDNHGAHRETFLFLDNKLSEVVGFSQTQSLTYTEWVGENTGDEFYDTNIYVGK